AAFYMVWGTDPIVPRIGFSVIGGFTCLAIYALGRDLIGKRVGLFAAALAAGFPMLVVMSGLTITENLAVPLLTLSTLLAYRTRQSGRPIDAIIAGFCLGLTALNRSVALALIPIWSLIFVLSPHPLRHRLLLAGLLATTAATTVLPWTVRNWAEFNEPILVDDLSLTAMYLGNNPYFSASPMWALDTGQPGAMLPFEVERQLAGLSRRERQALLLSLLLDFIANHPFEAARLFLFKLWLFWAPYPHPADIASWSATAALALFGVIVTWRMRGQLLLLYATIATLTLVHAASTALPRHRIILDGLILVLAAAGLAWFIEKLGQRSSRLSRLSQRPFFDFSIFGARIAITGNPSNAGAWSPFRETTDDNRQTRKGLTPAAGSTAAGDLRPTTTTDSPNGALNTPSIRSSGNAAS
ncbi:MAG: hypothetical protein HW416_3756, partial [Chloroflexi bacterium]|nr:hypothetical protein [Chloroflexota bacterium]